MNSDAQSGRPPARKTPASLGVTIKQPRGPLAQLSRHGWKLFGLGLLVVIGLMVRGLNDLINPTYGLLAKGLAEKVSREEGKPHFALSRDVRWESPVENSHLQGVLRDPRIKDRQREFVWSVVTYGAATQDGTTQANPDVIWVDAETGEEVFRVYEAKGEGEAPRLEVVCADQRTLVTFNPTLLDAKRFLELLDAAIDGGPAPAWTQPDDEEGDAY